MANLNDQDRQAIETAIFAGRKIEAIKLYRRSAGGELVEAKRAIEDLEVDLRRRAPENFVAGANKKGCTTVLACAALIVTGAVLLSFYILGS
jgi:ribosomal protein L7/L12